MADVMSVSDFGAWARQDPNREIDYSGDDARQQALALARELYGDGSNVQLLGRGSFGDRAAALQYILNTLTHASEADRLKLDGFFGSMRAGGPRASVDQLLRVQDKLDVADGVAGVNFFASAIAHLSRNDAPAVKVELAVPRMTGVRLLKPDQREALEAQRKNNERVAQAGPEPTDLIDTLIAGRPGDAGEVTPKLLEYFRSPGDHGAALQKLKDKRPDLWSKLRPAAADNSEGLSSDVLLALAGNLPPGSAGNLPPSAGASPQDRETFIKLQSARILRTPRDKLTSDDIRFVVRHAGARAGALHTVLGVPALRDAVLTELHAMAERRDSEQVAERLRQFYGDPVTPANPTVDARRALVSKLAADLLSADKLAQRNSIFAQLVPLEQRPAQQPGVGFPTMQRPRRIAHPLFVTMQADDLRGVMRWMALGGTQFTDAVHAARRAAR